MRCLRGCPDNLALIVAAVTAQMPRIPSTLIFHLTLGLAPWPACAVLLGFSAEKGLF